MYLKRFFISLTTCLIISINLSFAQGQAAASPEAEALLPTLEEEAPISTSTESLASIHQKIDKATKSRKSLRDSKRKMKKKHKSKRKSRLAYKRHKSSNKTKGKTGNWGGRLNLDWLMVILAVLLPAGLIAALYILLGGTVMTFFQMFLFALGFGFAFFSFWFLVTENNFAMGLYDFFVKYGLFSWPGIMALLAGFAALFGGTPTFLSYLIIGAIIGGVSLIVSFVVGKTMFNTLTY